MKSILFSLVFILLSFITALSQNTIEVITLESGSMLKGTVIAEDSTTLKLEMYDGSVWSLKQREIVDRTTETVHRKEIKERLFPTVFKTKGYMHYSAFGFSLSEDIYGGVTSGFNAEIINGYRFFPQLYTALELGVFNYPDMERTFFPFAIRVGGDVLNKKVTPTYYASFGYATMAKGFVEDVFGEVEVKGGILWSGGIGLKVNSKSKIGYIMHVGYRWHKSSEVYIYDDASSTTYDRTIRRLSFTFGFVY